MSVDTEWLVDFFRRQARLGFEEGDYTRTRNSCRELLQQQPKDREAWQLLGEAALASHDSVTALRAFDHLLELEPQNSDYAMRLGQASLQAQNWPSAISAFDQVLALQPGHPGALEALQLIGQLQAKLDILGQLPDVLPSRNAPCFCGSGLKYKKCCLLKSSLQLVQQRIDQAFSAGEWEQVISLSMDLDVLSAGEKLQLALARYQLGQRQQAYPLLKAARREWPADLDVAAALADLELDHDVAAAQRLAEAVLVEQPGQWRASLVLAAVHARAGRTEESERTLRDLVRIDPTCDTAWQRLSNFLRKSQREHEESLLMREWTERCPGNPKAWFHRGMSAVLAAKGEEARGYLQQALALDPQHHEAQCWIGQSYQNEQNPHRALEHLMLGLQMKPDYQVGWNMLGGVYHSVGRQHEAEGCFMRALAITPDQAEAWNNLANTYLDARLLDEAERVMHVGISLNGREPNLWNNLGNILSAAKRISEARDAYQKALEVAPDYRPVLINLAGVEANFGNLDRAIELLRDVLDAPQARTNTFFFANYHADWTGEQVFAIYQDIVERFYPQRRYFDYTNALLPKRRLRIGYISPDFRHHVCALFIEPLMRNHDHAQVEVFAYSLVRLEDQVTERFMGYADHWRHCVGLSNELIAEQIRTDQIDVLIDLAGHTANNGLACMALKPAPVQVSWWMGFAFGTGLKAIDYFLADEQMLPPGCESSFAEQLWRMPGPAVAYMPNAMMPEVSSLPALSNGYITFGSLTRPVRLNHQVIRVWSELLKRVPNSRLILDSSAFDDVGLCEHYRLKFAEHGIDAVRLEFGYTSPVWDALGKMDIALDCFPHNSGTTLYESLWMGLPVVTLRDRPSMGRVGALILHGMGRGEWCADSEEEYLDKLVSLAADTGKLARIRAGLREEMRNSPLCDGVNFARRMERTYQQMWQRYCEQGEQQ
ncbi:O-linked N-acetylglucosamine transferase family protein [Pseudomonas sp. Gutcm_11s]|uniref:O-linked N-acetylglucosamine transferase family protein n=1 Tax=Pseudomonas sp. Gutcm_11s TaxID=3026088 RepID=UPI00235FA20B|nr:tetratricopeptide repeat protein [Pseudomonas sp. Gutcm_11s]MDD0843882.1 tetratricopeptide repeat protein [Pseudomonas sp. Gutcm_11s]